MKTGLEPDGDRPVVLRTEHLGRVVEDRRVVDDISIEVYARDVVAITGPSGAGKSSFLRLLNRLDEPTEGTVYLDGLDYRQIAPRELRRRVGMVLQSPFLFPGTVAENLAFGPQQRGETLPEATIDALLQRVGLAGYATRTVTNLSGGEAQRVSLARTLANSPEVLLLDEPTSALDPETEFEVEALIRTILESQRLTALMVTHDMAQAERMANRAFIIQQGRLAASGSIAEVIRAEPSFQEPG